MAYETVGSYYDNVVSLSKNQKSRGGQGKNERNKFAGCFVMDLCNWYLDHVSKRDLGSLIQGLKVAESVRASV